MIPLWKTLGVTALGVVCVAAAAQQPADAPLPPRVEESRTVGPGPEPVRPEPEPRPLPPTNYLRGTANGIGNAIVIDNGFGRATTVLENSRNGLGNRVVIIDGNVVTDTARPTVPAPRCDRLGDVHFYSPLHGCTLYWNPRTLSWYRYDYDAGRYVPAEWDF